MAAWRRCVSAISLIVVAGLAAAKPPGLRDAMGRRGGTVRRQEWVVRTCAPRSRSCVNGSEGTDAEWSDYLRSVYGDPAPPPSVRHGLTWFYRCPPNRTAHVICTHVPATSPLRSLAPRELKLWQAPLLGEAFRGEPKNTDGLYLAGLYGFFVRRAPSNVAAADHTWVEVLRGRKADENTFNSTWYYVVSGSGVWLNVGRTTVMEIGARKKHHRLQVAQARQGRFDTLQFANAWDVGMHELVDLRPGARQDIFGVTTCGSAELRSGWGHARPCGCDEAGELINCAGSRRGARRLRSAAVRAPTRRRAAASAAAVSVSVDSHAIDDIGRGGAWATSATDSDDGSVFGGNARMPSGRPGEPCDTDR